MFYRDGLGLESPGVTGTQFEGDDSNPAGAVVMFRLERGLILALYPRSELAKDADIPPGPAQSGEFSLGQLVASRTDVDALLGRAKAAGATVSEPHDRPWGIYSGYFRDPDGHLWEVVHDPSQPDDARAQKEARPEHEGKLRTERRVSISAD